MKLIQIQEKREWKGKKKLEDLFILQYFVLDRLLTTVVVEAVVDKTLEGLAGTWKQLMSQEKDKQIE